MDLVWDALNDKYRPATYARCQKLLREFSFLDLEDGTDPVQYLDRLERLQAEMAKSEAVMNDGLVYCRFLMVLPSEYDVIKQMFSWKTLVRD